MIEYQRSLLIKMDKNPSYDHVFPIMKLYQEAILHPREEKVWEHPPVNSPQDTASHGTLEEVLDWLCVMSSGLTAGLYLPP